MRRAESRRELVEVIAAVCDGGAEHLGLGYVPVGGGGELPGEAPKRLGLGVPHSDRRVSVGTHGHMITPL